MKKLITVIFIFLSLSGLSQNNINLNSNKKHINVLCYSFISMTSTIGSYSLNEWMLDKGSTYGTKDPYTVPIFTSFICQSAVESVLYISIENYRPSIINIAISVVSSGITMVIKNRIDKIDKKELKL